MQSQADGQFRFIIAYQDHLTKYVQLRLITSERPEEVAKQLLGIYCIFGAPVILQSHYGRKFASKVIK
jgi:hypothetical protein